MGVVTNRDNLEDNLEIGMDNLEIGMDIKQVTSCDVATTDNLAITASRVNSNN